MDQIPEQPQFFEQKVTDFVIGKITQDPKNTLASLYQEEQKAMPAPGSVPLPRFSEKKSITIIHQLTVEEALAGFETPETLELIKKMPENVLLAQSTGIESPRATDLRTKAKDQGRIIETTRGIGGVNDDLSWELRGYLRRNIMNTPDLNLILFLIESITGLDTPTARNVRDDMGSLLVSFRSQIIEEMQKLTETLTFTPKAELIDPELEKTVRKAGVPSEVAEIAENMLRNMQGQPNFIHPDTNALREIDRLSQILSQIHTAESILIRNLAGINSDPAWHQRYHARTAIRTFRNAGAAHSLPLLQTQIRATEDDLIPGADRRQAMALRETMETISYRLLLEQGLLMSLRGIDTEEAHRLRKEFLLPAAVGGDLAPQKATEVATDSLRLEALVLRSLAGCESPEAWEIRRAAKEKAREAVRINYIQRGRGQEKEIITIPYLVDALAESLAGCDSDEAWELREELWPTKTGNGKIWWPGFGMRGTIGQCSAKSLILSLNNRTIAAIKAGKKYNPTEERRTTSPFGSASPAPTPTAMRRIKSPPSPTSDPQPQESSPGRVVYALVKKLRRLVSSN